MNYHYDMMDLHTLYTRVILPLIYYTKIFVVANSTSQHDGLLCPSCTFKMYRITKHLSTGPNVHRPSAIAFEVQNN